MRNLEISIFGIRKYSECQILEFYFSAVNLKISTFGMPNLDTKANDRLFLRMTSQRPVIIPNSCYKPFNWKQRYH